MTRIKEQVSFDIDVYSNKLDSAYKLKTTVGVEVSEIPTDEEMQTEDVE